MFGINKRKFEALHGLLWKVAAAPTNTRRLLALQKALIEQIIRVEANLQGKAVAAVANSVLKAGGRSRAEFRKIAELNSPNRFKDRYLKSLAVRMAVFRRRRSLHSPRQICFEADVLRNRISSSETICRMALGQVRSGSRARGDGAGVRLGIPVLLTDLTNTIRHGDLCILVCL